jgi:hypothetical protein
MEHQQPSKDGQNETDEGDDRVQLATAGQSLGEQSERTEGVKDSQGRQAGENAIEKFSPHELTSA